MPYIGRDINIGNFVKLDTITTSATTTFALTNGGVAYYPQSPNHCLVSLNGILQAPTDSFTISGSNIVFSSALTTSDVIDFIIVLGDVLNIGTPSDNTVSLAKLTATGTKDSTTFLRGDNTFAVPASGDFVRLSTQTISSAVSSVDFTSAFTSTYDVYVINFSNVVLATDNVSFIGRVITGTNTVQTATEYGTLGTAVGITSAGSQSTNYAYDWGTYGHIYFTWNTTFDNAATSGINGQLKFYNPNSTTLWKTIYQDTTYYGNDNRIWSQKINNIWRNATAVTGFRFLADSGNISSGVFSLYAYKKS